MKDLIKKLMSLGLEESEAKAEIALLKKEIKDQSKINLIIEERIKTRKPIQYIIGKAFFMDFEVKVNENVLIPRPETEILVEEAVKRLSRRGVARNASTVLDIGTGSGVIPIAIAKLLRDAKIISIDISKDALSLAKENAKINRVDKNIEFKICDLFSDEINKVLNENSFNLIISNPPYIKEREFSKLEPEIHFYEPKIAHCGTRENKSGLVYYERIIELCRRDVARNFSTAAIIALEINPPIVPGIKQILKKYNLKKYEIIKDYGKLDRCLFVYL